MSDAVSKAGIVWQTGSQQRTDWAFLRAMKFLREGRIGKLQMVRVGLPGGTPDFGRTAHLTQTWAVPEGFNYDMWLGPAPKAPYAPARVGVNFRWILDYSGGQVTDWGAHHIDCAQWGMGTERTGPIAIRNAHGKFADHPIYNTATDFYFECDYANGLKMIVSSAERGGVRFIGDEGWLWVSRGRIETHDSDLKEAPSDAYGKLRYSNWGHCSRFTDGVLDGKETNAPVEVAHRSITIAHLANIALLKGRDLRWNPDTEQILNDESANEMLSRSYRAPWKLT
jgi:hypothetical protein